MSPTLNLIVAAIIATTPSAFGMLGRWNSDPLEEDVLSPPQLPTTEAPVPVKCTIENGFFGDSGDETVAVKYLYEMEIKSESSKLTEDLIGELEDDFANAVLPAFSDDCLPLSTRRRRRLEAVGFSTLPADTVINGAPCQVKITNEDNTCVLVDSEFTIYTTGSISQSEIRSSALNAIQNAVSDGYFINDDIAQVTIVNYVPDPITNENAGDANTRSAEGGEPLAATMYIVIAAGVLIVVGAAIVYRRRRNQSNVDADSTIMTPSMPPSTTPDADTPGYDLRGLENP